MTSSPTLTPRRMPAEWEDHDAILLAWPHKDTDWNYMLDQVQACFRSIIKALSRYEKVIVVTPCVDETVAEMGDAVGDNVEIVECPTNDTWTRDYGPITISTERGMELVDFKFNGWGLKFAADRDNLVSSTLYRQGVIKGAEMHNRLNFVFEGGSIESNGRGLLMTTSRCLLSPNRNGELSRHDIEAYLCRELGAEKMIWLDHGAISGDDTDSHIDTLARFADENTILYVAPPADTRHPDYAELVMMERELKALDLTTIALPYAGPVYDAEDGSPLPATYANFLITPRAVFVPTYNLPTDAAALEILAKAFPGREVEGIDCTALIRQHGSLHCATMQLYRQTT